MKSPRNRFGQNPSETSTNVIPFKPVFNPSPLLVHLEQIAEELRRLSVGQKVGTDQHHAAHFSWICVQTSANILRESELRGYGHIEPGENGGTVDD